MVMSYQSTLAAGFHQHYFTNAAEPMQVPSGNTLYAYVYLDPANPPREVMLQWNAGGSWEHRAYWGENLIPWGLPTPMITHIKPKARATVARDGRLRRCTRRIPRPPCPRLESWTLTCR